MTAATDVVSAVARTARNARILASVLDALPPDVETPTHVTLWTWQTQPEIKWLIWDEGNQRERAAAIVRAIGGKWEKQPGDLFSFRRELNGVELGVTVQREAVCERVVTGTREITKTVPAPDAPMVEVTETVEDVEWVCAPLLSEVSA